MDHPNSHALLSSYTVEMKKMVAPKTLVTVKKNKYYRRMKKQKMTEVDPPQILRLHDIIVPTGQK